MDKKGQSEFAVTFDDAFDFNINFDESDNYNYKDLKDNGFTAIVKVGDVYGLINRKGAFILTPQFDDISCILNTTQFFAVKNNNVWGVINHKFETIVEPFHPPFGYNFL